jgi:hypothetical protein
VLSEADTRADHDDVGGTFVRGHGDDGSEDTNDDGAAADTERDPDLVLVAATFSRRRGKRGALRCGAHPTRDLDTARPTYDRLAVDLHRELEARCHAARRDLRAPELDLADHAKRVRGHVRLDMARARGAERGSDLDPQRRHRRGGRLEAARERSRNVGAESMRGGDEREDGQRSVQRASSRGQLRSGDAIERSLDVRSGQRFFRERALEALDGAFEVGFVVERRPFGEPSGLPKPGLPKPGLPKPGLPKPGLPKPGLPKPGLPKPGLGERVLRHEADRAESKNDREPRHSTRAYHLIEVARTWLGVTACAPKLARSTTP